MADKKLIIELETLKNVLVARGRGNRCDDQYRRLRRRLLEDSRVSDALPTFLSTCFSLNEFWGYIKMRYRSYAERDQFVWESLAPALLIAESTSITPGDDVVSATLIRYDSDHVGQVWRKAIERRGTDLDGAVTMARTLLESVCKHILDEEGITYPEKVKLPALYRLVSQHLNLAPDQHTGETFKQVLGGCKSVVEGLGSLRNDLGDAHAPGKRWVRLAPRHAELAVNLAGTMAMFLIQTWEARQTVRS